jgi:hypothetical protein
MHVTTLTAAAALTVSLGGTAALASAGAAPSGHDPAVKAGSFTVTVSVDETEPLLGHKVAIKGTVRPAVPGADVALQVKYEGRGWKTIDHGRLSPAGKFRFKDKVGSVRERRYRVVKPAGGHRAAGRATTEKVTVYGWRDLTSLEPATASNMYEAAVTINGLAHPKSVRSYSYSPSTGSIEYNLNRDCTFFRGTAGLDDSSPATGSAVVTVSTDGTQRYTGSFGLTQSAPVAFDTTGVFRLSFGVTFTNGGIGAVGSPEVLCSF